MTDLIGSGLAFPPQADQRGALALVDGIDDIEQAISLILGTAPGERPLRPEFGCEVHDVVFDTVDAEMIGTVQGAVRRALERWEPRIEVVAVEFDLEEVDAGKLLISLTYRVRETTALHNLVYPLYVIPDEELG